MKTSLVITTINSSNKDIGYLILLKANSNFIIKTDDDNTRKKKFF